MHLLRKPARAGLKPSLPCVKGGGIFVRKWRRDCKNKKSELHNPSVSFADSSLYTREPLTWEHSALTFCLFSAHRQSLYRTTRLSRGFRFTKKGFDTCVESLFLMYYFIPISSKNVFISSALWVSIRALVFSSCFAMLATSGSSSINHLLICIKGVNQRCFSRMG